MPAPDPSHLSLSIGGGANNMAPEYAIPDGQVRDVLNMDLNRAGASTRSGLRLLENWNCHSLYPHPAGGVLLVHDGSMYRVMGGNVTELVAVSQQHKVRYTTYNNEVFWANGISTGRVTFDGSASFWGLSTPPQPVVTGTTGSLQAGKYQVTYTAVRDGVESGAPDPVSIDTDGGILLTTPAADAGITFNAYLTNPNGVSSELRQVLSGIQGGSTVSLPFKRGMRLRSLLAAKPYPGSLLASYHGRLWIADGKRLWFTDSASPHWLFPADQFFLWPSRITLIEPVLDGLFVGTEQGTWMLQGDAPEGMNMRMVATQGVVFGTGNSRVPHDIFQGNESPCAVWLDTDGVVCCGRSGGIVQRITENKYRVNKALSGEIVFRTHQGVRQLLVVLSEQGTPKDIASDVPIADVY